MSNRTDLRLAKSVSLIGFVALVVSGYYLRSEVLALSHIRFSADEVRAVNELKQLRESYPDRMKQYEAQQKGYEIEMVHHRKMLDLYQNNYDEYVKRIKDKYEPPAMPSEPQKPDSPELSDKLHQINTDFRTRKNQYFRSTQWLNWIACIAAVGVVGGLVYLLLFDTDSVRWHYLVALSISFIFLIGPSFHSIITAIIGFLTEPRV